MRVLRVLHAWVCHVGRVTLLVYFGPCPCPCGVAQFIIQSTSPPVNESLMELLLMIRWGVLWLFPVLHVACITCGTYRWVG